MIVIENKKNKFIWKDARERALVLSNMIIAKYTIWVYPYFNTSFILHMDTGNYQLSRAVSQDRKPISFYNKKLNKTQLHYPIGEKELPVITEILKAYTYMLLCNKTTVYIYHINLIKENIRHCYRKVLWWRLIVREYREDVKYISGIQNVVEDTISRLTYHENTTMKCKNDSTNSGWCLSTVRFTQIWGQTKKTLTIRQLHLQKINQ